MNITARNGCLLVGDGRNRDRAERNTFRCADGSLTVLRERLQCLHPMECRRRAASGGIAAPRRGAPPQGGVCEVPVIFEGADGGVLAYAVMQCDRAAVVVAEITASELKGGGSNV